jgi:hypothetical protein
VCHPGNASPLSNSASGERPNAFAKNQARSSLGDSRGASGGDEGQMREILKKRDSFSKNSSRIQSSIRRSMSEANGGDAEAESKPSSTIGLKRISSSETLKIKMVDSENKEPSAQTSSQSQSPSHAPKRVGMLALLFSLTIRLTNYSDKAYESLETFIAQNIPDASAVCNSLINLYRLHIRDRAFCCICPLVAIFKLRIY